MPIQVVKTSSNNKKQALSYQIALHQIERTEQKHPLW